jgi:hypothetical protein
MTLSQEGDGSMSDELDVDLVEDVEEPERTYFVDKIDLAELRRYVCLDLARMIGPLPDKTVKLAKDMEAFLLDKGPREVK